MTSATGWREPTEAAVLRYGTYRGRYLSALVLLFAGGVALQFGSAYTLPVLSGGVLASIAGWVVVPSPGWRRCIAVAPAVLGVAALLAGAAPAALLTLTLGGWLLVRIRPLRSYVVLVLPVIAALQLGQTFPQYGGRVVVGIVLAAVMIGSAWIARSLAAWNPPRFWAFFQRGREGRPLK